MQKTYSARRGKMLVLIAVWAMLSNCGCRSLQMMESQFLHVPSPDNGKMDDFSKKITAHLYENGLLVGIGNDDQYLYVLFSPDIRHQRRPPSRSQLTLWLDENGKSAKKLALEYSSESSFPTTPQRESRSEMKKTTADKISGPPGPASSTPTPALIKIIDRRNKKEHFIAANGLLGPNIRLDNDWGDFSYQWRIPFKPTGEWAGLKVKPGQAIGIGLLWEIEPLPGFGRRNAAGEFPGPPRGRGKGMEPPPGMEEGDFGPGHDMSASHFSAKRKIWLKIILAKNKTGHSA